MDEIELVNKWYVLNQHHGVESARLLPYYGRVNEYAKKKLHEHSTSPCIRARKYDEGDDVDVEKNSEGTAKWWINRFVRSGN